MSASRAFELLAKPVIFQPIAFTTFALVSWVYMDNRMSQLKYSVDGAISKVIENPEAQKYVELRKRLDGLELTLLKLKEENTSNASSSTPSTYDVDTKIMDLYAFINHEVDSLQTKSNKNMTEISTLFDSNMNEIESRLNEIESSSSDPVNPVRSSPDSSKDLLHLLSDEVENLKRGIDDNMFEMDGRLKILEKPDSFKENQQIANKCFTDKINEIMANSDNNMSEIESKLINVTDSIYDIANKSDFNMNEIDDRFNAMNNMLDNIDDVTKFVTDSSNNKVYDDEIHEIKSQTDNNMIEIQAQFDSLKDQINDGVQRLDDHRAALEIVGEEFDELMSLKKMMQ